MVRSLDKPPIELPKSGVKTPVQETLLTPRFYTTDFDTVAKRDISEDETEVKAVIEEL
ncbi:MAG: magnesium-protoporphyrin IX monomethyl ester cyclase, partial [Dolichospermum sp.]